MSTQVEFSLSLSSARRAPPRRWWLRSVMASGVLHVGLLAAAAWTGATWQAPWAQVAAGRNAPLSIEAQFSAGDQQPQPTDLAVADMIVPMPSIERASPREAMQLTTIRRLQQTQHLPEPPQPAAPREATAIASAATLDDLPPRNDRARDVDLPVGDTPPAVPRAKPLPELRLEPIAAQVASAGAIASWPETGAAAADVPRLLDNPAPEYPAEALRRRLTGRVLLRVSLGLDGRVTRTSVHQSSGHALLDDAAQVAVRRWRFELPQNSTTTPSDVVVPLNFVLAE